MEKFMKFIAKFLALIVLLAIVPFILAYLFGLLLPTTDYWLMVKISRFVVLGLIVVVPLLIQKWRENQRFFLRWVGFLVLYAIVNTFIWVKGF